MATKTTFWTTEAESLSKFGSDAFNQNQRVCREAFVHDRASHVGRQWVRRRQLEVLIVDDDADAADGSAKQVGRWGHASCVAYNGAGALKMAAVQHPDAVLLDIAMPLMNGLEVARQLRRDFPRKDCFVIALTGGGDDDEREKCIKAGIDIVLIKPVEPAVLETLLMLESERMNRAAGTRQHDSIKGVRGL
jgi:CheY-like chemotaxis protein